MAQSFYTGKKIVITGGLGFLGSAITHHLIPLNPKEIILLDAMLPLYGGNFFNIEEIKGLVRVEIADIRDTAILERILPGTDVIFHIAGQTSHVDSISAPLLDLDINCRGTLLLLEMCRKLAPEVRIVYAGTRGQYGALQYLPVDELHPLAPLDIYGVHKQAGEWYHIIYHNLYNLQVSCLRISNAYGPRHQMKHNRYGVLHWFIRLAMDGQDIPIYGEGKQLRDYTYVDDVAEAFLSVGVHASTIGNIYNVGNENALPLVEIIKEIISIVHQGTIQHLPWPEDRKKIEIGNFSTSCQSLYRTVGWEPKVSINEGLQKTVEFYQKYRKHYW